MIKRDILNEDLVLIIDYEGLTSLAETGLNVKFLLHGILYNKNFLLIVIEIG